MKSRPNVYFWWNKSRRRLTPIFPWILDTGFWNDNGVWKDTSVWVD